MASTKLYLDRRGKAKDGKGTVIINLSQNYTTATFSTGVRVLPKNWNGSSVVRLPESDALNAKLLKIKGELDRKIAILALQEGFEDMTATEIKAVIENKKTKATGNTLVSDLFCEYMETDMKHGTRELYKYTLKKVLAFGGENITIDKITYKWLLQFERYLCQTQPSANGRSIYLRSLRRICNYAISTGIQIKYPFQGFHIKSEPTRKRSVTADQLWKFYTYPATSLQAMYRDYFFLMFFLIGINSKDLLLAKKSQYDGSRLEYVREKTGKKYSIKVEPEAEKLLRKYEGSGDYLLEALDHCKDYRNFTKEINRAIKSIGDETIEEIPDPDNLFGEPEYKSSVIPVIPNISTYYSRHTWATLAYEIGIPIDVISQALGHSMGNRTTLVYIKTDLSKVDEANRKVIDTFLSVGKEAHRL